MSEVKRGQIWADNDWRSAGRLVRILEVDATHASVEVVAVGQMIFGGSIGRRSRIRLDRFKPTSTGYRLVDPDPSENRSQR